MTVTEFHNAIQLKLDKTASLELPHFETEEIEFWVNEAIKRFCRTRYAGVNPKLTGFEQTQKRIDDLRTLVRESRLSLTALSSNVNKPNSKIASLSSLTSYWFSLSEEVLIAYVSLNNSLTAVSSGSLTSGSVYYVVSGTPTHDGTAYSVGDYFLATGGTYTGTATIIEADTKRVGVTEITSNNYYESLTDPYSEHFLHYEDARPLRLFYNDEIEFIHDDNYDIFYAYIRYLKQPQELDSETDVASGSIEEDVKYEVYGGTSVTYNGTTYSPGETFVGVSGVTTYTEVGSPDVIVTVDLPEHTHSEIVNVTVELMLENIEQPRQQTFGKLVDEME